jgi:CRISPR-associated protein Csd1
LINAYRNFVQKWNPKIEINNPFLLSLGKMYSKAGYAFCLAGHPELLLHDDPMLRQAWTSELIDIKNKEQNANTVQCGITGKIEPIARIHNKITKFPNGASTGNVLVNFKWPAFESYGKKQSYNSNISKTAMKKYTGALNALVKDPKHRLVLKGLTVLYWAMSESDLYSKIVDAGVFHGFDNDSEFMDSDETDAALRDIMKKSKKGAISGKKTDISEYIDPNVSFYLVGLKSNSSRIAVEFVHRDRFGNIFHHITQHQADIQIGNSNKIIPLWRIEKELVNPKSNNEEGDPALLSRIFECIFKGYQYPPGLLATIIRRIKSDSNTEKNSYVKLNQVRAGIIKGYLNRKSRISGRKEEIFMALNRENDNPAYLCGRLFAVLEKLQIEASNNTLNRTIKDAYFSSACSTPKVVFPQLIKLSQHHIPKATYGGYWNYLIGEITGMLETNFPKILSLDEQGAFILGYYQQFWAKNDKKKDSKR